MQTWFSGWNFPMIYYGRVGNSCTWKKTTTQIYIHIIERLFGKGMNKLVSDFETLLFVCLDLHKLQVSHKNSVHFLVHTLSFLHETFIFISAQDGIISKPETQFYASSWGWWSVITFSSSRRTRGYQKNCGNN